MNYTRIAIAAVAATLAYFVLGFLVFAALPMLRTEFQKYPAVYRPQQDIQRVFPLGMVGILVSIAVLAVMYAMMFRGGGGLVEGARFGALVGLFSVGAFVLHNYVNLNIGLRLTVGQATAYFIEWTVVGIVIGLIYKPPAV